MSRNLQVESYSLRVMSSKFTRHVQQVYASCPASLHVMSSKFTRHVKA